MNDEFAALLEEKNERWRILSREETMFLLSPEREDLEKLRMMFTGLIEGALVFIPPVFVSRKKYKESCLGDIVKHVVTLTRDVLLRILDEKGIVYELNTSKDETLSFFECAKLKEKVYEIFVEEAVDRRIDLDRRSFSSAYQDVGDFLEREFGYVLRYMESPLVLYDGEAPRSSGWRSVGGEFVSDMCMKFTTLTKGRHESTRMEFGYTDLEDGTCSLGISSEMVYYHPQRGVISVAECRKDMRVWNNLMVDLSLKENLKIFADVLQGLVRVHEQGVLHTDLKPHNVRLKMNEQGEISGQIFDWESAVDKTKGAERGLDFASDVYSKAFYYPISSRAMLRQMVNESYDLFSMGIVLIQIYVCYLYKERGEVCSSSDIRGVLVNLYSRNKDDEPNGSFLLLIVSIFSEFDFSVRNAKIETLILELCNKDELECPTARETINNLRGILDDLF